MKRIAYKMVASIVPIVIIALVVVSSVAVSIAKTELVDEMNETMASSMQAVEFDIQYLMSEPEKITETLAKDVGSQIEVGGDLSSFEQSVSQIIDESEFIVAIGFFMAPELWGYEPSVEENTTEEIAPEKQVDETTEETVEEASEESAQEESTTEEAVEEVPTEEAVEQSDEAVVTEEQAAQEMAAEETEEPEEGLVMNNYYWAKDGNQIDFYDVGQGDALVKTEWYQALESQGGVFYTENYIDTTLGIMMTSYVVAICDNTGRFIGCANVDIDMSAVQNVVNSLLVGETGRCMLLTIDGQYLTGEDTENLLNEEVTIETETAIGLGAHAEEILNQEAFEGVTKGTTGNYYCYTKKFDSFEWILITYVSEAEVVSAVTAMTSSVLIISIIAIIICVFGVIMLSQYISKSIIKVKNMAELMSEGDFTMEPLSVSGKDEIASMTEALNKMLESNRNEMQDISSNSNVVSSNSEHLRNAVRELETSFEDISKAISIISGAMMDNNATTEELTASVAEVKDAVQNLAEKAKESETMASEIMARAKSINKESTDNFDNAMTLTKQYEVQLNDSIENSKVVEEIGIMADAINDIASQINLLSLNASIEAARAGEAGKGFAVVATEIGNLASQTSSTVASIQDTIIKVKAAVTTLADNSEQIINYINESVTPDYKNFVDVSVQYEEDAVGIKELSEYVSDIAGTLSHTMEEFNKAIQNIAEMSQSTTESASSVLERVDLVSENVENVDSISGQQLEVSQQLDDVVARYKI